MQKAFSMAAAIAALTLAAACAAGDGEATLVAPHGPAFGKTTTPTDPNATLWFPLADAGLGLQSDHLYTSGDSSAYADGVCGVHALMFAYPTSNSGDVTMQTDNNKFGDRHCANYPRKVQLILRDDLGNIVTQASTTVFMNVHDVQNTTDIIPIGTSVQRAFTLNEDPHCNGLRWALFLPDGTTPTGADKVIVTRTKADTWTVQTQPYPNDKAYCVGDGQLYHVPVRFTIVTDQALP